MKKIAMVLVLMACVVPAFALDAEHIDDLQRQKRALTESYEKKQKELSEITLKLHEINARLSEAKGSQKEERPAMRQGY